MATEACALMAGRPGATRRLDEEIICAPDRADNLIGNQRPYASAGGCEPEQPQRGPDETAGLALEPPPARRSRAVASRSTTDEGFRSYWLDVRLRQRVSTELDLEDYVDVIHADIVLEEETGPEQIAGRVSGYVLRFDQMADDGIDPLEACDAHSQATLDYYVALFDPDTHEIKADIDRALQGLMFGNVLILDVIELLPAHRGRRLGLQIARRFIEMFDTGCCLVICDPFPLQFGNPGEDAALARADAHGGVHRKRRRRPCEACGLLAAPRLRRDSRDETPRHEPDDAAALADGCDPRRLTITAARTRGLPHAPRGLPT